MAVAISCGGGGDKSTGPQEPLTLSLAGTPTTSATVGSSVSGRPAVRVMRGQTPAPNVAVTFTITGGGGSATGTSVNTDASGVATVGSWTLGTAAGANTMVATVANVGSVGFTVTGTPGAPATLTSAGSGQQAQAGAAVPQAPSVRVFDQFGNPVPGVAVTFAVTMGGGSITGANATTGANGTAAVGSWTLGAGGENRLSATVAGLSTPVVFTATALTTTSSNFNVELRYVGAQPSSAVLTAFNNAAARWSQVITGDLTNVGPFSLAAGSCGNSPAMTNETIDDVLIFVEVDSIDGPGKTLGQAGPCYIRNANAGVVGDSLTVMGTMKFDRDDLQGMVNNGTINDVILHEMGHVLGLGTLAVWSMRMSHRSTSSSDTSWIRTTDVRYAASGGNTEYFAMSGSSGSGSPIENCGTGSPSGCGPGTWLGHWRESFFKNELMTGYISSTGNPMSRMTVATLQDMGYTVNMNAADSYTIPTTALFSGAASQAKKLEELPYTGPVYIIDPSGRVVGRMR